MSLGFLSSHNVAAPPRPAAPSSSDTPSSVATSKSAKMLVMFFFTVQVCLGLSALGYDGLKLKWALTYGHIGHKHPHVPEEDYLQDNNNVISVFFVGFAFDICEPFVILLLQRLFARQWLNDIYSAVGMLSEGAALGSLFVLVLLQYPQQTDLSWMGHHNDAPPAPPPLRSPVFTDEELVPLFVLTILLGVLKVLSYVFRMPQRLAKLL